MQYLMMDLHQRFIGTLMQNKPLVIGDVFKAANAKSYTVVSIDSSRGHDKSVKSLTVIAHNPTVSPSTNVAAVAAQ